MPVRCIYNIIKINIEKNKFTFKHVYVENFGGETVAQEQEKYEYLGKGIYAVISSSHGFGTDALLLADFASPKTKDRVCDMGTGCGIIPLAMMRNASPSFVCGIEIQPKGAEQFRKGIEKSGLSEKMQAINCDIKDKKSLPPAGSFDIVTMNPPYKGAGAGIESTASAEKIARHETLCTADDVCAAASYLVRYGGRVCFCYRPERLCEILCKMSSYKIEPKRIRFVSKNSQCEPWLVLIEGRKGGKPGMRVEKNLFIQNPDGSDSEELLRILGDYRENVK